MATHKSDGHTIDVCSVVPGMQNRLLMVTVDGDQRLYASIWTRENAWNAWEGEPGGWFPAETLRFTVNDNDTAHDGRVEFDYSALTGKVRYRVVLRDNEIAAGEL